MTGFDEKDAVGIRVLLSVGLGTCMSALDASVVNTVLPVIREAYHVPVEVIQWVSTTYLLLMGSLLLPFGGDADRRPGQREDRGPRRLTGFPRNGSSMRSISGSSLPGWLPRRERSSRRREAKGGLHEHVR